MTLQLHGHARLGYILKRFISTSIKPMTTKLYKVVTQDKDPPITKLYNLLMPWSIEVMWKKEKRYIYFFEVSGHETWEWVTFDKWRLSSKSHNALFLWRHSQIHKATYPLDYKVIWGHLRKEKWYNFTSTMPIIFKMIVVQNLLFKA